MTLVLESIFIAMIAAAIFALTGYFRQVFKDGTFESFSLSKFVATLLVGAFVGVTTQVLGIPLTQEQIEAQLVVYAGAVVLVENVVVGIIRFFRPMEA